MTESCELHGYFIMYIIIEYEPRMENWTRLKVNDKELGTILMHAN